MCDTGEKYSEIWKNRTKENDKLYKILKIIKKVNIKSVWEWDKTSQIKEDKIQIKIQNHIAPCT